jgi:hypothetical protein
MELRQAMSTFRRPAFAALVVFSGLTPASAQVLPSGWTVAPVEAPLGEAHSCAATKMTGTSKGIGFTRMTSGLETMTVAVEGWAYPLGQALDETMKIGDAAPLSLQAFGQDNATMAKGSFSTNKALRAATLVEIGIGDRRESFDIGGLDKALDALAACAADRA